MARRVKAAPRAEPRDDSLLLSESYNADGQYVLLYCAKGAEHVDGGRCPWDLGPNAHSTRVWPLKDPDGQTVLDDNGKPVMASDTRTNLERIAKQRMRLACLQLVRDREGTP